MVRPDPLARLAARLALRATQAPRPIGALAQALEPSQAINRAALLAPTLRAIHRAAIRAGVIDCNHGGDQAERAWDKVKARAVAQAPRLLSIGLVLCEHSTDPRGPMLILRAAPATIAPGWPDLMDPDHLTPTPHWCIPW